ncbi:tail fiber protein [Flavobacterium sp.]|uniref:phage tail protein n=1 Tax=Flavobacterium sp. TaxID=239 RepID=UPI002618B85F|nr:tail fiber protein [Flavobacterium sp.]
MDEYLGAIKAFGFNFAPRGWAFCDGQLMSIAANTALFSLLGTTYGGDGRTTFGLPDLRGRSIVHPGTGPGFSTIRWGQMGGYETETLTVLNMPVHNHVLIDGQAIVSTTTQVNVAGDPLVNVPDNGTYPFAAGGSAPNMYSESATPTDTVGGITSQSYISGATGAAGGSQPFSVRSPYLGIYTCICTQGIYPPRS